MKRIIIFLIFLFESIYVFSQPKINYLLDINSSCYLIYHEKTGYTICFKTTEEHDYYLAVGSKTKLEIICKAAVIILKNKDISDINYTFKGSIHDYIYQFTPYNGRYISIKDNHQNEFKVDALHFLDILEIISCL